MSEQPTDKVKSRQALTAEGIHSSKRRETMLRRASCIIFVFFFLLIMTFTLQLNPEEVLPPATFGTSRGHH